MRKVLFVGNSHLVAVRDAAGGHQPAAEEPADTDFMWRTTGLESQRLDLVGPCTDTPTAATFILIGAWRPPVVDVDETGTTALADDLSDELCRSAEELGGVDLVVSYLGGSEHSIFSLVEHETPFDVLVDPNDRPVPSAEPRQIVPATVVQRELERRTAGTMECCRLIARSFPEAQTVHLLAPPPIADADFIRAHAEVFTTVLQERGVAPADLRRRVFAIYREMARRALEPAGVKVLDPPDASYVDGFLRPELYRNATHANRHYGRLVLEQLKVA
jgi:hypothetical protein